MHISSGSCTFLWSHTLLYEKVVKRLMLVCVYEGEFEVVVVEREVEPGRK